MTPLPRTFSGLQRSVGRLREPKVGTGFAVFVTILVAGVALRLHYSAFLDPFEDGYQHWWISANLVTTGEYWDRHSMMTQGNWLPLYHFFGTAVLGIAGVHNITALKIANIAISTLTAVLVFLVLRKHGVLIALGGMSFFSFNFIDIVVSGWSTAESLATFLAFLGYSAIFHLRAGRRSLSLGSAALALAAMTRYEAWLLVALLFLYVLANARPRTERRQVLMALLPAIGFMAAYFIYSLQWGFLPSIVINQTSTDIRYQISVGTQRSPGEVLSQWWSGYVAFFPVLLVLGSAYAILEIRREFGGWILAAVWLFTVLYTVMRFGNPSFRYVLISVPFLSVMGALAAKRLNRTLRARKQLVPSRNQRPTNGATALIIIVVAVTMLPGTAWFWTPGFPTSTSMIPLQRAGEFVSTLPVPAGKILLSESPIAAYFSGYAPDRILGSRFLPDNRSMALAFLKTEVAYIVYMGVPYYRLRTLFPELESGASTPDLELLYDAGGNAFGTHTVLVFRVVP